MKRGSDPRGIFRTLATGLDGSPMPAFSGVLTDDEMWSLVSYVRTLAREKRPLGLRRAADKHLSAQYAQAKHAVTGGCGCQARGPSPGLGSSAAFETTDPLSPLTH